MAYSLGNFYMFQPKFQSILIPVSSGHRTGNKQKGHSSWNLCSLYPYACRITHVHYAGSSQSVVFTDQ